MNERIRELAFKAANGMLSFDEDGFRLSEKEAEKFAELIVRECVGLCDQAVEENKRTFYTANETREVGPALVAKGCQVQAEKLSKQIL